MGNSRSAFELACEYIVKLDMSLASNASTVRPYYCQKKKCNTRSETNCITCCMQYFRQKAGVSDEQNIVKEIYKKFLELDEEFHNPDEFKFEFWKFLDKQLKSEN